MQQNSTLDLLQPYAAPYNFINLQSSTEVQVSLGFPERMVT